MLHKGPTNRVIEMPHLQESHVEVDDLIIEPCSAQQPPHVLLHHLQGQGQDQGPTKQKLSIQL